MEFFSFANGKKFNLSEVKSGIKIDDKNEFLKKYDKNQNSIFDFDEVNNFKEDLKPYLADGQIDDEECISLYAKVMNMTTDAVRQLFSSVENNNITQFVTSAFDSLEEAQAHKECIEIIQNTALKANTDMMLEDKGSITELWDKLKNLFGTKLSSNQIYKIIFEELFTAEFLEDAENGKLTKSEYIERKIENTKALALSKIMKENLEETKEWAQTYGISNFSEKKFIRYMDAYLTTNLRNMVKQAAEQTDGKYHYYETSPAMVHPQGKYASNALDLVNSIQDMLIQKYHGKNLTDADMADINENIGEIHWILSHSMPWGRGSAGISDAYVKALYKSLGIQLSQPKQGVSFDLEAFCTELEETIRISICFARKNCFML